MTRRGINEDTTSYGVGPIDLDVEMARHHGWSQEQLEHAAFGIAALSREVSYQVAVAAGHTYKCLDCECWTVQPPAPCHLCNADREASARRAAVPRPTSIADQPPPVTTTHRPAWDIVREYMELHSKDNGYGALVDGVSIWGTVMADMAERDAVGRSRYGTPLTAHNGRDDLIDAYQEALDFAVYLVAWLDEFGVGPSTLINREKYGERWWTLFNVQDMFALHIRTVVRLRALMDERNKPGVDL